MNVLPIYLPSGWQLVEELGEGSYGVVYRAQRVIGATTEVAAIKHISLPKNKAELNAIQEDVGGTADDVKRYLEQMRDLILEEYSKMAELQGHTNIVACQDVECYPKQDGIGFDVYIRMELLESVSKRIHDGRMDRNETVKLGMDICRALDLLQQYGIIHRDIKPQNLFVNVNGDYKIGDFGTARSITGTSTMMSVKGTFAYMAPEVMLNQKVSYAADTYSLGLVLYRLMNGNKPPFIRPDQVGSVTGTDTANSRRLQGEALPVPAYADRELASVILKACEFDPKDRWNSAADMYNALGDLCGTAYRHIAAPPPEYGPADVDEEEPVDDEEPPKRHFGWVFLLILLIAAGSFAAYQFRGELVELINGIFATPTPTHAGGIAPVSWEITPSPKPEMPTPSPKPATQVCSHQSTTWTTENATCTEAGSKTLICQDCGYVKDIEDIPANGHSYQTVVTRAATCGKVGVKTHTCSRCGDSYTTDIPKTDNHSYRDVVTKAATCGETGVRTYTCSTCGHSYTKPIAKTNDHNYRYLITKKETCTETGLKTWTCSICHDSYTEPISKKGHNYTSTVTSAATCTTKGVKTYKCTTCGHSYTESISATGKHNYTSTVTRAATCGSEGVKTYRCTTCGHSYTEPIPATEKHSYTSTVTKAPSCTSTGARTYKCTTCGHSYIKTIPKEHVDYDIIYYGDKFNYSYVKEDSNYHGVYYDQDWYMKCKICGVIFDSGTGRSATKERHKFSNGVCSLCGYDESGAFGGGGGGFR